MARHGRRVNGKNHPWLSQPVAQPPAADAAPYFRAPGETHVGSALGRPREMCQNLADQARRWLRKALVHELAWMRVSLRALSPDAQAELRKRLPATQRGQLGRLLDADPFPAFCDAMQTDTMVALACALVDAGVGAPSLPPLVPPTSGVAPKKLSAAALLSVPYKAVEALPEERRASLELTLPPAQRAELERLRGASIEVYCQETAREVQAALFVALQEGLDEWAYHPEELQRLTRAQARDTIERLDEAQLVIESILSDEWENWGDPRCLRGAARKPEQCVPVGSVYGGSWALMVQMTEFENEHRLKRLENAWWYVDSPAPESTGN